MANSSAQWLQWNRQYGHVFQTVRALPRPVSNCAESSKVEWSILTRHLYWKSRRDHRDHHLELAEIFGAV